MQGKGDVKLGRFISLVLRHDPSAAGIRLDRNGWADVKELIQGIRNTGREVDFETLKRLVAENDKKRYCFTPDFTMIRACQGHSVNVDVELKTAVPPSLLYHGTAVRFLDSIRSDGLLKQNRQHVHLSADQKTAVKVGSRHGKPAVLAVNAGAMVRDGHQFWCSENQIWLCNCVPVQYLSFEDKKKE